MDTFSFPEDTWVIYGHYLSFGGDYPSAQKVGGSTPLGTWEAVCYADPFGEESQRFVNAVVTESI